MKRFLAIILMAALLLTLLPTAVVAGNTTESGVTVGDFTIWATNGGTLTSGTDYSYSSNVLTINSGTAITISNTTSSTPTTHRIEVASGVNANITLAGVNIDLSSTGGWNAKGDSAFAIADNSTGNVAITLAAGTTNTLKSGGHRAGLEKNGDGETVGTLTITGTGTLLPTGMYYGAGIGGGKDSSSRNITIKGGTITARSMKEGAGIGGGSGGAGSNITIEGGTVKATGGQSAAGIGGGRTGTGSNITISGGFVTAYGDLGAGIGGGRTGTGSNITISGGTVVARSNSHGAGIGGGSKADGSDITISGGTVTAQSGTYGAGIGGGSLADGRNIIISGGSVQAIPGSNANAIGGGAEKAAVTPKNQATNGKNVYLLTIANPNSEDVTIDGTQHTLVNHKAANVDDETDSANNYLYAYVTGEHHTVQVGNVETCYHLNATTNQFVKCQAGTGWQKNDTEHWHSCQGCNAHQYNKQTHSYNWKTVGTQYWKECVCGKRDPDHPDEKAIPSITINGNDKVCNGKDYTFTLTVPGENMGTYSVTVGSDTITDSNGTYTVTAPTGNFTITVNATTEDGFGFTKTKDVTVQSDHSYNTEAHCTVCGYDRLHSVTFDEAGGQPEVTHKTNVKWGDKVLEGVSNPNRDGYRFAGWKYGEMAVEADTTYGSLAEQNTLEIQLVAQWTDSDKPVIVGLTKDKTYCGSITFTVSDNVGVTSVTAGGQTLTAVDGKYTLEAGVGQVTVSAKDADGNEATVTVTVNEGHTGGTATCTAKVKCSTCGNEYGEKNPENHTGEKVWAKTATSHKEAWNCCDVVTVAEAAHTFENDVCTLCGQTRESTAAQYPDVDEESWYHEYVDYVVAHRLMIGYDDGEFKPQWELTRAELVQILYNRAGRPAVTFAAQFTDVKEEAWYAPAVIWAAQNGIVNGLDDGTFAPDKAVTREEMATMLYREAGEPATQGSLDSFVDHETASEYAVPALRWAVEQGILEGDVNEQGQSCLRPKDGAKRCEVAAILYRYIG